MTEDQLEREALCWLTELGYTYRSGPDIAHDGAEPQRAHYRQVLLPFRLREAIQRLNPAHSCAGRRPATGAGVGLARPTLSQPGFP